MFAKILDKIEACNKKHIYTFTDFLDPAKTEEYVNKLNSMNINYKVFGGYEYCERKVIGFYQDYMELEYNNFPIRVIKIKPLDKFTKLTHREYLGGILGTGIDRCKLGDIFVLEDYAYAFVYENISEYIFNNLVKISHSKVENSIIDLNMVTLPQPKYKEIKTTIASLRLDAIISATFHISRSSASNFISAEKVNINWSTAKSNSILTKEGDIFTLRGYGRAKLVKIGDKTRKDRISIIIHLYI